MSQLSYRDRKVWEHAAALGEMFGPENVRVGEQCSSIMITNLPLPAGWNRPSTNMLILIPPDYPTSPPGPLPNGAYLSLGLRYHGQEPPDYHEKIAVAEQGWAWICYEDVSGWDPRQDDLLTFISMVFARVTEEIPSRR